MSKIAKVVETAQLIQTLETFRDVLMKSHHEDIVAGVKVPKELKQHDEPVPYEHPHRELASKFVTDVHRRNKFEGARMSEKYLGIGVGGRALHPNAMPPDRRQTSVEKAMTVGPASVSSPLVIGNQGASTTQPQIIQSPNVMNPYLNKHGADHPVHKLLSSMKSRPKGN